MYIISIMYISMICIYICICICILYCTILPGTIIEVEFEHDNVLRKMMVSSDVRGDEVWLNPRRSRPHWDVTGWVR